MGTAVKVILYVVIITAMYCEEYNVPVMLYVKRMRFLADWKLAAYAQRQAIDSYLSYQKEAELVRG